MSAAQPHSALTSLLPFGAPIYLLIDPFLGDPVAPPNSAAVEESAAWPQHLEAAWERTVYPVHFALAATVGLAIHQLPYLVALTGPDDPLLAESLEMAQAEDLAAQAHGLAGRGSGAFRIGGWLQTGEAPESVAAWLAELMRLRTSGSTSAKYLRLADRRVLALARHVLSEEVLSNNMGPIERWGYLDPWGAVKALERRASGSAVWRFTNVQWEAMQHGEWLHRALAQVLGHVGARSAAAGNELGAALSAAEKVRLLHHQWPQCFASDDDQVTATALNLVYPGWEANRAVLELLGAPSTPETRERRTAPAPGEEGTLQALLPALTQALFGPQDQLNPIPSLPRN